jgi:serine/threonine-protein kinase
MSINQIDLQLGKKALEHGFLTPLRLQNAIVEFNRRLGPSATSSGSLGFFLLSKGYLTPEQLAELMREQPSPTAPVHRPAVPATPPPRDHARFGKYTILRELGRGSMGEVLEALDTTKDRRVALKRPFIKRRQGMVDPVDEERFLVEANIAGMLPRHPNIVEVYESGKIDGQCYIAMEILEGETMTAWRRHATFRQEVDVILQVAEGIHHAHEHGVIHRDLKPSNVMIRADGRAIVADFGLAKATQWTGALSLTPMGYMVGSPGYMSPEQAACTKNVDRRTDVYSLGVMLYQALTGRKPFEGRTAMEIILRMEQEAVRRPSEIMRAGLNPVLYQELETVCMRALQRNPRDRYASARLFSEALSLALRNLRQEAAPAGLAG